MARAWRIVMNADSARCCAMFIVLGSIGGGNRAERFSMLCIQLLNFSRSPFAVRRTPFASFLYASVCAHGISNRLWIVRCAIFNGTNESIGFSVLIFFSCRLFVSLVSFIARQRASSDSTSTTKKHIVCRARTPNSHCCVL